MRARRALLYVPGDDLHKIQKSAILNVDCICLDLEDGVALSQKDAARETILEALKTIDFGNSEKLVRINPLISGLAEIDLQKVLAVHPDGIVLPKVDQGGTVLKVSRFISSVEQQHGWTAGKIALIAIVESARGILNLAEICSADPRLQAVIFGGEDLAADLGAIRTREAWEVFCARSATVLHATVAEIQAIDMVNVDFHDLGWLEKEAKQGAEMGFSGKQVIHPAQVEPVQKAFTPDEKAVSEAEKIVRLFEENQKTGKGAFAIDGKMVDMPVVKRAQNILRRAGKTKE
jgi:citrate lyase beta subunit